MAIDLGTGSGQAVLRRARQNPKEFVIGVDADASAMADSSRKAAANLRRGGLPNVVFLAALADVLPGPLAGRADVVTVALPWGSLLRGLLNADSELLDRITACLRDGGQLEVLLSATERDATTSVRLVDDRDAANLASALEHAGLHVVEWRTADASDVNRLSSGWGRRLGIPERRTVWLYRARPAQAGRRPHAPSCRRRADERASRVSGRGC